MSVTPKRSESPHIIGLSACAVHACAMRQAWQQLNRTWHRGAELACCCVPIRRGLASCSSPAPSHAVKRGAAAVAAAAHQRHWQRTAACGATSACDSPLRSSHLQRWASSSQTNTDSRACKLAATPSGVEPEPTPPSEEGPWTREDLERMVDEEQQEEQEALGGTWRQHFEDDPEMLFNYTEQAYEELGVALDYVSSIADPELQVRVQRQRRRQQEEVRGI